MLVDIFIYVDEQTKLKMHVEISLNDMNHFFAESDVCLQYWENVAS